MKQCFTFRLQGTVLRAPEPIYRPNGARLDALRWWMRVSLPPFEEGGRTVEMDVELEAWGRARAAVDGLRVGQECLAMGNVVRRRLMTAQGDYATRKDGSAVWLTDFRVSDVFVAPMSRAGIGGGAGAPVAAPKPPQQPCPPASTMSDEDIPF